MALASFILAPRSNELEKWSCVRHKEGKQWFLLYCAVGRQGGKARREGRGNMTPLPTGTHVPMSQKREKSISYQFETWWKIKRENM